MAETKLHELLAVKTQLNGQAQATRTELRTTFEKKRHLFEEKVVTFHSNEEGAQSIREQQSDLQSKVVDELGWIAGIWSKALDVSAAIENANTRAKADVVLDSGKVLLRNVPATALLELEKRAAEIQELILAIPTLDPAKGFTPDPNRGANVYVAREVAKTRTKKAQRPIVLYDATEHHPAQAQLISEDIPVGRVVEQEWSGLVSPAEKGVLLERAEEFSRAVKKARQRANDVEIGPVEKIGQEIFGFVFFGRTSS
jgi:hypothetical protein